jgi:xanthine dehydrogenase YagS FAD-binding subunit
MYLGGGTNLVDLLKLGVAAPSHLVDVSSLNMDLIVRSSDGGLLIGAGVRNADLAANEEIRRGYPVLAEAILHGASGQVRNVATVAGNLLQRTRCPYFQDSTKPCNKREPGTGCPAREGEHRNLAIIGHSDACVATHPSDMAVAFAALGATVQVHGKAGARAIPMPGLHRLPGEDPDRDTVLSPGELITAVSLPPPLDGARSRYRKVRERASFSFAIASVAAIATVSEGTIRSCRIALGGIAPIPWRAKRAEAVLTGSPANEETFVRAAEEELAVAQPLRDNGYKVMLARNLLVDTLREICG